MTVPAVSGRLPVDRVLLVLLATIALHQVGTGLLAGLVPVRLAAEGHAAAVAGSVSTGFSIGFVSGCLAAPFVIARLGARRAVIAVALTNAAMALMLRELPDPAAWTVARAVSGFAVACLFTLMEAWLAQRSTAANRGAVFGTYMLINRVVFMGGQLVLAWVDPLTGGLFLLAAAVYALSPWPVLAVGHAAPPVGRKARPAVLALFRRAPGAAVGALIHGLMTVAAPALFPIYAVAQAMPTDRIALALAAMQFGGLALQLPLALLSDRLGRRTVMGMAALATGVLSLAAWWVPTGALWLLLPVMAGWVGAPAVIYSLAAAHANDIADDGERVSWSSGLLMLWGLGAALGPLAASFLMDGIGDAMLFVHTGVLGLALALFLAWRKIVRRPPDQRRPLGRTLAAPPAISR